MICYKPFWKTLKESNESTYSLISYHKISSSTIQKLRHDMPMSTTTINDLCRIFNCPVENIVSYIESDEDQLL
ncbi:MAG: helix-turn-helix transcriptional regulator [Eubacterium sp.]|nr:helix-turn-helix transcriptional regulator [Eubacterium sp.]